MFVWLLTKQEVVPKCCHEWSSGRLVIQLPMTVGALWTLRHQYLLSVNLYIPIGYTCNVQWNNLRTYRHTTILWAKRLAIQPVLYISRTEGRLEIHLNLTWRGRGGWRHCLLFLFKVMLCHWMRAQAWVFCVGFADDSRFVIKTHLGIGTGMSVKRFFSLSFLCLLVTWLKIAQSSNLSHLS